jgi:putative ABC transport system permease protein
MSFLITFGYLNFPDLTAAGSFVLGSAVAAIAVVHYGIDPHVALLLAGAAGAAAGAVTAFFNVALRIERLLAGILAAFFLYAVNQLLLSPTLPYGPHPTILAWAEPLDRRIEVGNTAWHPYAILVFAVLVIAVKLALDWYLHSEVGLALRALEDVDAGEEVLRRNGLSPERYRSAGLMMANALVGVSGAVVAMRNSAANVHTGLDAVVTGLIAYLIGMQIIRLTKRLNKGRNGSGAVAIGWVRRIEPTSAAILGTLIYFGLIDLSLRMDIKSEFARIVLVVTVAMSVGDVSGVRRALNSRRRMSSMSNPIDAPLLSLRNIVFRYPTADEECIRNESLEIAPRERIVLAGANGTGKSTLLKIASGLLAPLSGEIRLKGRDVTNDSTTRLANVVYVDQNPHRGVVDTLTVEENLVLARTGSCPSLWRKAVSREKSAALERVLEFAGFPPAHLERDAGALSGGQRQITNLLTLLARRNLPQVVLLDEPANNLDVDHAARFRGVIEALRQQGVAVVLVSHAGLDGLAVDRIVRLPSSGDGKAAAVIDQKPQPSGSLQDKMRKGKQV